MKQIPKRIRQTIARTMYYGLEYPIDYLLVKMGKRKKLRSVEKKEQKYQKLNESEYIKELGKWFYATTGERLDLNNPQTFNF